MSTSTSMSTPVSQLPPSAPPPSNVRHDEDQIVADVLSELQHERRPSSPPPSSAPTHHVANVQQYMLPSAPPSPQQQQRGDLVFGVIHRDIAIKVAVAAIAALVIFYPETLSDVYSKVPSIGDHLITYDKFVRALFLAVLLYVLLMKLDI